MSKLSLTVRIGANSTTFDANSNRAADFVAASTLGEIVDDVQRSSNLELSKLAKNLPKVVENSYIDAVRFAATQMIGTRSPLTVKTTSEPVEVRDPEGFELAYWPVLSTRTIREQNEIRGSKGQAQFFNRSGALRMDLLGMARNLVKRTGVVRVTYNSRLRDARGRFVSLVASQKKVSLGDFNIRLLPNVSPTALPGIKTGIVTDHDPSLSFERRLGFSPAALKKLKGASKGNFVIPGTHRPLLQPAFTYWTLNRIPQVIARSISAALPRRARVTNDYGATTFTMGTR